MLKKYSLIYIMIIDKIILSAYTAVICSVLYFSKNMINNNNSIELNNTIKDALAIVK